MAEMQDKRHTRLLVQIVGVLVVAAAFSVKSRAQSVPVPRAEFEAATLKASRDGRSEFAGRRVALPLKMFLCVYWSASRTSALPLPRNTMSLPWPKRIIYGQGWVTFRSAHKTGFSEGKIR